MIILNKTLLAFLFPFVCLHIAYAHNNVPAPDQKQPILLTDATIHPISSAPISNGEILFDAGKIIAVGKSIELPPNTKIISLPGKHVYPGFIAANTQLGLTEISAVRATIDTTESGALNPNARAEVSFNPDSELIPVTRSNGVLTAQSTPVSKGSGIIAGSSAAMKLDGWAWEEMTIKAPIGIHIKWPKLHRRTKGFFPDNSDQKKLTEQSEKKTRTLTDAFADARAYLKSKNANPDNTVIDIRWEALIPVLEKRIPVFIHANSLQQLRQCIHFAKKENLRLVIVGGQDAWRIPSLLKANDISVIVTPILTPPMRRWEPFDTPYRNPTILREHKIPFCIASGGRWASSERNLPYHAAMAAAHGLPREEALRAITLYPAQILGIDEQVGSLEAGKAATLFVSNGDPLDIRNNIEIAFIFGRKIDLSNRQTRLYEKYKQKYKQLENKP